MDKRLSELIDRLNKHISDDDFMDVADEVTEELEKRLDAFDAIESILMLMENNPDVDYGMPGALVHFMETFYKKGYEEKLVESLTRKPTEYTVWMLNRLINDCQGERKKYYLNVLDKVIAFPNLENKVVLRAQNYKSFQSK
jgi:hypothetical protein